MEWLRISTSTELVRVATDEIVYVRADGNYSDLLVTSGEIHKMTFQLHFFEEAFNDLQHNTFVRVGRSLIVNKRFIYIINLTEQLLVLYGKNMSQEVTLRGSGVGLNKKDVVLSRESLKHLMDLLMEEKRDTDND